MGWAHEGDPQAASTPDRALSTGEQILAASDRAGAPLTTGLFLQTDGQLDPVRLRAALWSAIGRHPMARALLNGSGQPSWRFHGELVADPFGFIDDGTDGWRVQELLSSAPFALHRYPPVRFVLVRGSRGDQICAVAHHLALDGLRLAALVTDVLAGYRQPGPLPGVPGGAGDGGVRRGMPAGLPMLARPAGPVWPTLARRSGRLISPQTVGRSVGFGFHPLALPHTTGSRTLPDGRRLTVNDLLLAATHLAIDRWNISRGGQSGRLAIRMPIDPASSAGHDSGATPVGLPGADEVGGNRTGQSIIVTDVADRVDVVRLAVRVKDQTALVRQVVPAAVPGLGGMVGMAAARYVPGSLCSVVLRAGIGVGRLLASPSAALSNLGRHEELLGPLGPDEPEAEPAEGRQPPTVTDAYFTGTAGMPQGLLVCAVGTARDLKISIGYHRQLFGPRAAAAFAELFCEAYLELAAIGGPRRSPEPQPALRADAPAPHVDAGPSRADAASSAGGPSSAARPATTRPPGPLQPPIRQMRTAVTRTTPEPPGQVPDPPPGPSGSRGVAAAPFRRQ